MSEANGHMETKLPKSSALAHFKAYPIIDDIISILKQYTLITYILTYLQQAKSFASPYLVKAPLLVPTLERADVTLDDYVLTKFDQFFPQITQLRLQELYPSSLYNSGKGAITKKYHATTEMIIKNVHTFEDKTRPVVSKRVDPIVAPINDVFEKAINTYLPEDSKTEQVTNAVPTSGSKDEIDRFIQLGSSAYNKTVPLFTSTKEQVVQIPGHIQTVYKEELESSKKTTDAIRSTSAKLSNEAIQTLKPIVDPILSKVETLKNSTNVKIHIALDTTKNNIDGIVSEAKHGIETGTLNGSASNSGTASTPIVAASA